MIIHIVYESFKILLIVRIGSFPAKESFYMSQNLILMILLIPSPNETYYISIFLGFGILRTATGAVYEGGFQNHMREGEGAQTYE